MHGHARPAFVRSAYFWQSKGHYIYFVKNGIATSVSQTAKLPTAEAYIAPRWLNQPDKMQITRDNLAANHHAAKLGCFANGYS